MARDNHNNQLGTGDGLNSTTPVAVAGGHTFRSIACGQTFTCGLDTEGRAWCWGKNEIGQLGTGNATSLPVPAEAAAGRRFVALAAGGAHTCGVQANGSTLCWGDNKYGQLGTQLSSTDSYTPVEVAGNHTFVAISNGMAHSCALEAPPSSRAWCWGWGEFGQLGNGGEVNQRSPVPVSGVRAFAAIAAGGAHTCALTLDGSAWCWGGLGLSNGQELSNNAPELVIGGRTFVSVSTGSMFTCGVDTSQSAWCWGSNDDGQLGNGTLGGNSSRPVQVAGGQSFLSLDAGEYHACAVVEKKSIELTLPPPPVNPGPTPPAPAPAPSPSPPTDPSSSSSAIIGAVVGSLGAAAVLAVLAFFALRPHKGWLRRKHPPASVEDSDGGKGTPMPGSPLKWGSGSLGGKLGGSSGSPRIALPASGPPPDGATASDSVLGPDTLVPYSHAVEGSLPRSTAQAAALAPGGGRGSGGSGLLDLQADPSLWDVQWPELTIVRRVGRGSFGSVYLAEWKRIPVAVKLLVSQEAIQRGQLELPEKVVRDLHAEAAMMNRMRHPNIVQFLGLVTVPPALVTEYCSRGSLYSCLAAAHDYPAAAAQLTWQRRLAMAADAGAGLLYLHSRNIIHRDVKSPNILVDADWHAKVADFNLSKMLEGARSEAVRTSSDGVTNPLWLAPEVIDGKKATAASDVYSFGMVLYELLTWRLPWSMAVMSPFKIAAIIRQGGRPEVPPREALPGPDTADWAGLDDYVRLMRACWAPQPEHRPSFDEVVQQLKLLLEDSTAAS
ncbi:Serine threonine- kinase CTR1 [Chlorella sorokiniana]|uniref:Serine threonine-kinase CTR1 n=1 Tax=Chlorella sorokiniana TaxID=3076 RepID=A0A2P6TJ83_CHLSO|nr:Serine threonine- kinase CTR1 [Chlorella sorokiniana]|eukprot:PRW39272.1 Serine threonine- kinase CTR1 [Chlorella sorokiniana]